MLVQVDSQNYIGVNYDYGLNMPDPTGKWWILARMVQYMYMGRINSVKRHCHRFRTYTV